MFEYVTGVVACICATCFFGYYVVQDFRCRMTEELVCDLAGLSVNLVLLYILIKHIWG